MYKECERWPRDPKATAMEVTFSWDLVEGGEERGLEPAFWPTRSS